MMNPLFAQYRISGFVYDQTTHEKLIGANLFEIGSGRGTATDADGYFSFVLTTGNIQISFIGYKEKSIHVQSDTLIHVYLESNKILETVTIKSSHYKRFNVSTLSHEEMVNIPSLGGKPDVLKSMQQLPGIQSQQEGSSLLNVRGGNPGENLYLIDNVPLIYVNHLGGFSSVFNPDMINNIELYKAGFPAKYGGKLSSVVAITQREGSKSNIKSSLGLGITDASFCLEGPIIKQKASFIVTGRKTLTEPFFILASKFTKSDYNVIYGFHDINGKISWHPDPNNSIYLNIYQGDDYLCYWNNKQKNNTDDYRLTTVWGSRMVSWRWSHIISTKLFMDHTLSYTDYRLRNENQYFIRSNENISKYARTYRSQVADLSARTDWKFKPTKNWNINFGAKLSHFAHIPSKAFNSRIQNNPKPEIVNSFETNTYLNNEIKLFSFLEANLGMRLVHYRNAGLNDVKLEPRLSFHANISKNQMINLSYQHVNQYSHLLFTSGSLMNNEVWIPASDEILPSNSVQYSFGWKGRFIYNLLEIETACYYKTLNQLSTFREGYTNLMGDGNWRNKIASNGTGISKGIELFIRKTSGNWTGFGSYNFSQSTRYFPSINEDKTFLFDFDRPHVISINLNKKFNQKWSFNTLWTYQTGLPYTPVVGRLLIPVEGDITNTTEELIYGDRNSERMGAYHRLDIGFVLDTKTYRGNRAVWNFSIYNLYNKRNASTTFYDYSSDGFIQYNPENYIPLKQYETSFFPIIPTVSYKVYFEQERKNGSTKKKNLIQRFINYMIYEYE